MKQVLVVDDSAVIRKVARRILEGLHFRTSEAPDGKLGLAECEKMMPDVILLDWNMPEMDGLEFLCALRKMPGGTSPKVVFLHHRERSRAHRARHARRRRRIYHEAVRSKYRALEVPGNRPRLSRSFS